MKHANFSKNLRKCKVAWLTAWSWLCAGLHCAESDSAQANTARSFAWINLNEYLCENKFLRETILTCLSGAQMGWIIEIKNTKKSRDFCHFNERSIKLLKIRIESTVHYSTHNTVVSNLIWAFTGIFSFSFGSIVTFLSNK